MDFSTFLASFRQSYPEFNTISAYKVEEIYNEVMCVYPEVYGITKECTKVIVAGYVVAHIISVSLPNESGVIAGNGNMLSSASVGGISVSTQSPPVHDMYEYYFGSSPYGLKFLSYLASVGGINYVN